MPSPDTAINRTRFLTEEIVSDPTYHSTVHMMSWALQQRPAAPLQKLILIVLANGCGWGTWITAKLAEECCTNEGFAIHALKQLARRGLIELELSQDGEFFTYLFRI